MKRLLVVLILVVAVLAIPVGSPEPEPSRIRIPANTMKKAALILHTIADELAAASETDNLDEHIMVRCEQVFDERSKEIDFPGPNVITRPLARKAIRPVVKALIRYATEQETFNDEGMVNHGY